jgi:membrane protein DedA with SNARE-associated domain
LLSFYFAHGVGARLGHQYGAVSLFFLMMLGIVGLPIPDETLLVFSGYLIFKGKLNPVATFGMAFLGV